MKVQQWRILLAEDNVADAMLIEEAMKRRSVPYEIDHYLTATDAILAVTSAGVDGRPTPDLILLDYNLPGGQGLDILAAARGNPNLRAVPKAIISSFLRTDELHQATEMGALCVIGKPSSLNDFLSQVGTKIEELLDLVQKCDEAGTGG
jgi:two-component system, chemotaxis family, response regulator Rcp1